ncbi:hypothetical protein ACFWGI_06265 [Streptomyces niveus]|uniref:hypothetical protein n=1 Tax=Streptomyces niveus TaxID=193462 RepID=UPI0036698B1F
MNNGQYGAAPQHELNVLSALLRERSSVDQLVDWNRPDPQYWLRADHFETAWLGDVYQALLTGGLAEIEQRLLAYPHADPAQVTADAVMVRMRTLYQQRAAAGDLSAQAALNPSEYQYWAAVNSAVRQMARPSWPANPQQARHDAYVTVRAASHPSAIENVPFELVRARGYDNEARHRELAVIVAIINDPARAAEFWYTPSSPEASPYWLQPQDFGDPVTAEIWDALVTGPDPAIALPAAKDPSLTPQQRAAAMIRHITTRLDYNDYHRSTGDQAAKDRLDAHVNQEIGTYLAHASRTGFSPNPGNVGRYAVTFILDPSIPAAVEDLAGRVRDYGLADASLGQIGLDLSTTEYALSQLGERLDAAPATLASYDMTDRTAKPAPEQTEGQPSYTSPRTERRALISLLQDPHQLAHRPARSLAEQDFTRPEHRYLFKAIKSLPPDSARNAWFLGNQVRALARNDGAPPLDFQELNNIYRESQTTNVPSAGKMASHLVTMTVRRTARDASTAAQAAAQKNLDPRTLIERSRDQFGQATREALRYHAQSVPEPSQYGTQQAHTA